FSQSLNDLVVSVIGTSDRFNVRNWYLGSEHMVDEYQFEGGTWSPGVELRYQVEQFKTANGETLLQSQVQNLVDAMAAFAPPAAGQTTLAPEYASQLNPVIAANWQ